MHFYNVSIILVFFNFFLIFENGFLYLVVVAFSSVDFFFLSYICIFKSSHFESKIVFFCWQGGRIFFDHEQKLRSYFLRPFFNCRINNKLGYSSNQLGKGVETKIIAFLTRIFFGGRAKGAAGKKIRSCPNLGRGICQLCCRSQSDVAGVGDVVETVVAAVVTLDESVRDWIHT